MSAEAAESLGARSASAPAQPPRKRGWRISIRLKLLLVIATVVLSALAVYVYLATSMFTRDKLSYVYDMNAALVETLSEQTRASLEVLAQLLSLFGHEAAADSDSQADANVAQRLFEVEPALISVELYAPSGANSWTRKSRFINETPLETLSVSIADLEAARASRPVPLPTLPARDELYLHNSSIPPDAPILTMALPIATEAGERIVVADFRHERLLRIFSRSPLSETYLVDARGEVLAHPDGRQVVEHTSYARHAMARDALQASVRKGVREFQDASGRTLLGAYARVGLGRLAVLAQVPKSDALRASRTLIGRSIAFAVVVLLAAILASVFLSRWITTPIRRLRAATEQVGRGDFDIDLNVRARDEIGDLADSFQKMGHALKQTQSQLIHSEKLAAFGQLGAGITHEVKNPMTAIIGFAQLAQRRMNNPEKVAELLGVIEKEGKRCQDILVDFLEFARHDIRSMARLNLDEQIRSASRLFSHQLSVKDVSLSLELSDELPPIWGNGAELQQVLLNLAINAQQAMPNGGRLWLRARATAAGGAELEIEDNGPGMPPEVCERVFEPFFTTKERSEGTGLGLSICRSIIEAHGGTIQVDSEPGSGTRFIITLPPLQEAAQPSTATPNTAGDGHVETDETS